MAEEEDYGLEPIGDYDEEEEGYGDDDDALGTFDSDVTGEHWDGPLVDEDNSEDLTAFDVDIASIKNPSSASTTSDFFGFQQGGQQMGSGSTGAGGMVAADLSSNFGASSRASLPPDSSSASDIDRDLASMLHSMVLPHQTATPERGTSRIESRFAAGANTTPSGPAVNLLSRLDSPNRMQGPQIEFSARGGAGGSAPPRPELTEQQQKFLMQLVAKKEGAASAPSTPQRQQVSGESESNNSNNSLQQRSQQNSQRRQRWNKHSQMMSADEIDMIIRIQEQQLGADSNPFLEDYYAQQYQLLQNPRQYQLHRPIMDPVTPQPRPQRRSTNTPSKDSKQQKPEPEKEKEDPFQNVLGRIPSHSVRAPRPLLVFDSDPSPLAPASPEDPDAKASELIRASLQKIEAAFVTVLELEDLIQLMQQINALISQAPTPAQAQIVLQQLQSNFNLGTLMGKRQQHCLRLAQQLGLSAALIPDQTSPIFAAWEQFILAMICIPKGARLFARALPLLVSTSTSRDASATLPLTETFAALQGVLLRNSSLISVCAHSERHQMDLQLLADFARSQLARADTGGFTQALKDVLVDLNTQSSIAPTFVIGYASTRFGAHILTSLLKRLFEICQTPSNLSDTEKVSIWRTFYSIVFNSLGGSFSRPHQFFQLIFDPKHRFVPRLTFILEKKEE
eukprot:TRINITY_DN6621_c0_g2_i1.p1 TRINITY_DN6621_c0_g2~~TRINITY_DN6621_c0_g2_i1.p1  ORF type:complete len:698 (+),score=147.65 TRINITY_DN6621_c0_g2_i1:59-2095(+)